MVEALFLILGFALGLAARDTWNSYRMRKFQRNFLPSEVLPEMDPNWKELRSGDTYTLEDGQEYYLQPNGTWILKDDKENPPLDGDGESQ